jgi:hypothetical protein
MPKVIAARPLQATVIAVLSVTTTASLLVGAKIILVEPERMARLRGGLRKKMAMQLLLLHSPM